MELQLTQKEKLNNIAYLLKLLSCAVNDTAPPEPCEGVSFQFIYEFAKLHRVANTAFYAVEKLKTPIDPELYKKWKNIRNRNVHKNLVQKMEFQDIAAAFEQAGIYYMPFKGFSICEMYPKIDYREMNDLDFLIKDNDLEKAGHILTEKGYSCKYEGAYHHDEFCKAPFMIVETHRDLVGIDSPFFEYFDNYFSKAKHINGCRYEMSHDDFYIFNIVHLHKHYSTAGCGIRMFLDLYLMNEKQLPNLDRTYIAEELGKLGLSEFWELANKISRRWFSQEKIENFSEDEKFIFSSSAFGTKKNKLIADHKDKTDTQYVAGRLFPPLSKMQYIYPVLRNHKLLLPVFYVKRLIEAPFKKGGKIKEEIKFIHNK